MSEITEYKCPYCGGTMEFDSKLQKMKCPYCDSTMTMEEFEALQKKNEPEEKKVWKNQNNSSWQPGETEDMRVYVCNSCGGEIVTDQTTGATTCPYCGNRVTMKGQFENDLKPDYVIPFKKDKKEAKQAYKDLLKGKFFLPSCFKKQNHIDEIKGIYVPFWIFDIESSGNMSYSATRIRSWQSGNKEYTETKHYEIERAGDIAFDHVPTDSSKKMDDTLMESIEPFDFKDAVPFKAAYLAGYMADRYDVKMEDTLSRAQERAKQSMQDAFKTTIHGYDTIVPTGGNINIQDAKYWYTLYPVWILNTTWKGKKYVFAMNGQTGKITGDLPCDKSFFWSALIGIGTLLSIIVVDITYFFF